jgi:hypothetical protein
METGNNKTMPHFENASIDYEPSATEKHNK